MINYEYWLPLLYIISRISFLYLGEPNIHIPRYH